MYQILVKDTEKEKSTFQEAPAGCQPHREAPGQVMCSPGNGDSCLLLSTHGDATLQVVELAKVLPQCAAALKVPGHVDSALEGKRGTGGRSYPNEINRGNLGMADKRVSWDLLLWQSWAGRRKGTAGEPWKGL